MEEALLSYECLIKIQILIHELCLWNQNLRLGLGISPLTCPPVSFDSNWYFDFFIVIVVFMTS